MVAKETTNWVEVVVDVDYMITVVQDAPDFFKKINVQTPTVGLEPTTTRLRALRSTN